MDAASPLPAPNFPPPDRVRLLWSLGDRVRLRLVLELAEGQALPVATLAARIGESASLVSKHLRVLRDCGAVVRVRLPDTDGREMFHQLPEGALRVLPDGSREVDWQVAVVRFPARTAPG